VQTLFYGVFSAWVLWCKRPTTTARDKFNWHEAGMVAACSRNQNPVRVEVLRRIEATLKENGGDALTAHDVKAAAMERIFGFELLPAPFVVAHLQLGLFLQNIGAPLSNEMHERVGVYLTNALTGWQPPDGPKQKLMFSELEEERDAAELVKRDKKILVVLGNPPYFAFAGVSPEEEQGLVEPYKQGLFEDWNIRKYNLDELYVRFLRLAERRIAEMSRRGVICYISSYSYLSDPSFVVVRSRLSREFDAWIDCLNGDSRETGKLTPDGDPDPSVFSTLYNREGIRLGTAVGLFVKRDDLSQPLKVRYRDFWGTEKRGDLLDSLAYKGDFNTQYQDVNPDEANWFSFRPSRTKANYKEWPSVVEFADAEPISGLQEMRRGALMAHERETLEENIVTYLNAEIDWHDFAALDTGLSKKAGRFDPAATRTRMQETEKFDSERIRRYALYPLDNRWCYHSTVRPLWNEPRPELLAQRPDDEAFFIVRRFAERPKEGRPATVTSALPDYHLLRPNAVGIPMRLRTNKPTSSTGQVSIAFAGHETPSANLSDSARAYLASLTSADPDADENLSRTIWHHALAIIYAPAYLSDHGPSIREAWPRVPLPVSLESLHRSAQLGVSVAALLDVETPVLGVITGKIRRELFLLGRITGPKNAFSLAATAGWGHLQKDKAIVMPGKGLTAARAFSEDETAAIAEGAKDLGLAPDDIKVLWGHTRYIPQRRRVLVQCPSRRLGVHDRRLSGSEEMAQLPGNERSRPRNHKRRGARIHLYGSPPCRASPSRTPP
jgi:hypothetical protein